MLIHYGIKNVRNSLLPLSGCLDAWLFRSVLCAEVFSIYISTVLHSAKKAKFDGITCALYFTREWQPQTPLLL